MPEHTLPDALHPQQEDAADELQLRGGLKGRFFADFCLLQSTVAGRDETAHFPPGTLSG